MSELNYKQWFWTECDELNKDTNFSYSLAEKAWNHQQAKIDELKKLRSLDEMTISQLAQANQVWQSKCNELQARVDSLTNINESLVAYKNQLLDEIEEKGNKDEN